jgi:hypothetical protein
VLICRNNAGGRVRYGHKAGGRERRGKNNQDNKSTSRLRTPDVMKRDRLLETAASGVVEQALDLVVGHDPASTDDVPST